MKAALLKGPGTIEVSDVPIPNPPPGWVRVKVVRAGICGTDKAFFRGTYRPGKLPIVPGHEFAGIIDSVGENVDEGIIGAKVTSEINVSCGMCWFCMNGMRTHCPYRKVLGITIDGGMAEYVITPVKNIHIVDGLTYQQACFVEPLAAVLEMIKLAPPPPDGRVAILGLGTIGLLALQVLRLYAPRLLVAVARSGSPKFKLAKSLGADLTADPEEALEIARTSTPEGAGFDYVVEATGSPEGLNLALRIVRPRGVIAGKSTHGEEVPLDYTSLVVKEVSLVGSRCGPFPPAIRLIREGLVRVDPLVTSTYELRDIRDAFEASFRREEIKVQVKISKD